MSSSLAQYFHQERFKTATITMNVAQVRQSVEGLINLLFPQRGAKSNRTIQDVDQELETLQKRFVEYFNLLSVLDPKLKENSVSLAKTFFDELPNLAKVLDSDVSAAYAGDPAAYSFEEVILTYPGFFAVCVYRMAHKLYKLEVPLLPRLMSEYAHERTGIDIHPGANIGASFFIDHGTGVVIGETSDIGNNVKIYQGVTLGALSVKKRMQNKKRHPTIQDDVVIYANSTILGGETIIGQNSVIGGNTWITQSLPPNSVVFSKIENTISEK
jgi:serine O-acetyltransferase